MISVSGMPTFEDYLHVQRFHGRSRALAVACILALMALVVWLLTQNLIFPISVAIYVLGVRPLYVRMRLKRHWQLTPSAQRRAMTYGLDETGFHAQDDEGNLRVTHWNNFLKFRESRHSFLLYLNPNLYIFLPKRFMSLNDQELIRSVLMNVIGRSRPAASP